MVKLSIVNIDDTKLYDKITSQKTKKCRLNSECFKSTKNCEVCQNSYRGIMFVYREYILSRYCYYRNNIAQLEKIKSEKIIPNNFADLLCKTFENSTDISDLKTQIRVNIPKEIKGYCPYCMINEPNTFDHYFPKKHYPEFAFFSYNLVPCCSKCNTLKGDLIFSEDGERMFINFYFDDIMDIQFIKAKVYIDNEIPTVTYYLDINSSNKAKKIIEHHFAKLKLLDRYTERSISVLNEIQEQVKQINLKKI